MARPWTFAIGSCLLTFFRNLTSHIPSLTLPCNNRIPSRTTSTSSHDGASPTPRQVTDYSISIEKDVSLPITDGATRTSNAYGTRSPINTGSSRVTTFNLSQPGTIHPIAAVFQRLELGKTVLGFAVPMTTGLFLNQYHGLTHLQASAFATVLSIGFAATWNGMLLHGIYPRAASALEYFGVLTILIAFFGLVSSFLPPCLAWASWLCCGLSCLPFLLCLVLPTEVEEASSTDRPDPGMV